jgi:hypothetical protein
VDPRFNRYGHPTGNVSPRFVSFMRREGGAKPNLKFLGSTVWPMDAFIKGGICVMSNETRQHVGGGEVARLYYINIINIILILHYINIVLILYYINIILILH